MCVTCCFWRRQLLARRYNNDIETSLKAYRWTFKLYDIIQESNFIKQNTVYIRVVNSSKINIGYAKHGCENALCNGFEFCKQRLDIKCEVNGRCCKYELLKCPARIKTLETRIVQMSQHDDEGNSARSKAKQAVFQM